MPCAVCVTIGKFGKAALMFVMAPQRRQRQIGERRVGQHDGERDQQALFQP